jgi:prepilin-type processing-associated H-X9-DG protein
MASGRTGNEAEEVIVNGGSNVLYIDGGRDSGSRGRSLAAALSIIVRGSRSVVRAGLLPADRSSNGSQE